MVYEAQRRKQREGKKSVKAELTKGLPLWASGARHPQSLLGKQKRPYFRINTLQGRAWALTQFLALGVEHYSGCVQPTHTHIHTLHVLIEPATCLPLLLLGRETENRTLGRQPPVCKKRSSPNVAELRVAKSRRSVASAKSPKVGHMPLPSICV